MSSAKALPRDAKLVSLLLATAGAEDAEPGVVAMLLEFAHRWTSEVLQDSLLYREHAAGKNASAGTGAPTLDDLRLAIQAKVEYTASSTLSKELSLVQLRVRSLTLRQYLLNLANQLNRQPLPQIEAVYGPLKLPPEKERLTAVNFDVVPRPRPAEEDDDADEDGDEEMAEVEPQDDDFEDVTMGLNPSMLAGRL